MHTEPPPDVDRLNSGGWALMRARTAAALVAALLAASCGDDGSSAAPEPQQATRRPPRSLRYRPAMTTGLTSARRAAPAGRHLSGLERTVVDRGLHHHDPRGWNGHTGHYLSKYEEVDETRGLVIYPVLVDEIYADPCEGERGPIVAVGPEVNDLVDALLSQPGTVTTEPVQTTIGGRPGTRVDLEVPKGADLSSCLLADYGPRGSRSGSAIPRKSTSCSCPVTPPVSTSWTWTASARCS